MLVKGHTFSVTKRVSSGDLMYHMMTMVNNRVLHILLRVDLMLCSYHEILKNNINK